MLIKSFIFFCIIFSVNPYVNLKLTRFSNKSINLDFPDGWLDEHSMTLADLIKEINYLDAAGYKLSFE